MRKLFLINILSICAISISAQLKIQSDGKVEITPSGLYGVHVNVAPSGNVNRAIYGFSGYGSGTLLSNPRFAIPYSVGVIGTGSLKEGSSIEAVAFGVIGQGSGNTKGRNIGIFGYLNEPPSLFIINSPPLNFNGAGVFGATKFNQCFRNFTKAYAGYFAGDVEITNQLNVIGTAFPADIEYHLQDVADLNDEVKNILYLTPVVYNLKQRYTEYIDSTGKPVQLEVFDEKSQLFRNKHYGLIAQEVQKFYPDLVYEDGDGYLSVDYMGLIPVLLKVVQQQQEKLGRQQIEIDVLKNESAFVSQNNAPPRPQQQETTGETIPALFQNVPNPFNENTEIAFYLPQSVTNAMLCIYDMNGRQLSQNIITQRGNASFIVNGSQYGAGMYLYSLIADNQIVDTKRMILTK